MSTRIATADCKIWIISGLLSMMFLSVAGCDNSSTGSVPFASHEFDLGGNKFSIKLPKGAGVHASDDRSMVMMSLQPGTRNSPSITLREKFTGDAAVTSGKSVKVGRKGRLNYNVSMSPTVGSGGPEALLNGQLAMGNSRYIVSCTIQSEYVTIAQAGWCVTYLGTLALR